MKNKFFVGLKNAILITLFILLLIGLVIAAIAVVRRVDNVDCCDILVTRSLAPCDNSVNGVYSVPQQFTFPGALYKNSSDTSLTNLYSGYTEFKGGVNFTGTGFIFSYFWLYHNGSSLVPSNPSYKSGNLFVIRPQHDKWTDYWTSYQISSSSQYAFFVRYYWQSGFNGNYDYMIVSYSGNYADLTCISFKFYDSNGKYFDLLVPTDTYHQPYALLNNFVPCGTYYNNGLSDNSAFQLGYSDGYSSGYNIASDNYSGFGIFKYATWSIVNRSDYNEVINNFYGRVDENNFDKYNGGFIVGNSLYASLDEYFFENQNIDSVFKIAFDNPIPVNNYNVMMLYNFQFANNILFAFDNGSNILFEGQDLSNQVNLSSYNNLNILYIVVSYGASFGDYGKFGIAFNAFAVDSYNNGYHDGYEMGNLDGFVGGRNKGKAEGEESGYNQGYNAGVKYGKQVGYDNGINDANVYTFDKLLGAVVDAPFKTFTSLFNFEILGFNFLSFVTGLLTIGFLFVFIRFIFFRR